MTSTTNEWEDVQAPPASRRERYVNKFKEETVKFRILWTPAVYREFFDKTPKPVRSTERPDEDYFQENCGDWNFWKKLNFVWAIPVWDYQKEKTIVLELKRNSLIDALRAIVINPKRGNPIWYDIEIKREWMWLNDTKYFVTPEPPKELTKEIQESIKENPVDVSVLIENWDPFELTETKKDNLPF